MRVISAVPSVSVPVMMGIMVDFSRSSMGQENRPANMATLAHLFEKGIHDLDGAFLVAFGMSTFQLTGATPNTAEFKAGIKDLLDGQPIGATALFDSVLQIATTRFQELPDRKVILVLSEFQESSSLDRLNITILAIQEAGVSVFGLAEQTGRHSGKDWKLAAKTSRKIALKQAGKPSLILRPKILKFSSTVSGVI